MREGAERGSYARRLAVAAIAAVGLGVVLSLLGPDANPDGDWYVHTGIEGELRVLDAIEIVPDEDPVTMREARRMTGATQGVPSPVTETVVNPDNPDPVALERPLGRDDANPDVMRRVDPEARVELQEDEYVEMNRPSQQSEDFVVLHSVQPRYPRDAPPALRARDVVVRVNMYVDETGQVTHAYVDRNEGGPRFEAAVLEAVNQWVYRPYEHEGVPTGFWDTIYFVFRVGPGAEIRPNELPLRG